MNKKTILLGSLIGLLLIFASCTKSPKKKSAQLTQSKKAPESLITVMEDIDGILDSIRDMEEILGLSPGEFEVLHSEADSGDDKAKKENKMAPKDEEILREWKTIDEKIEKLHKDWNAYESKGIKKGANIEKGQNLKKNLNSFTRSIENRNITSIMDDGSKTLFSLSHYFDLYRDEILGDLARMKYIAYQAYLKAEGKDLKEASRLLGTADGYMTNLRQKLDKDRDKGKMELLEKLSLSIGDMKQSLGGTGMKLLEVKRDIILENIEELED
ncbi:MAG: hypothetical protein GX329_00790 [Tissierellia bacterium]|nr:hypothetical protein [Tissierellia bacterium]